jgi:hypothetical protein
VIDAGSCRMGRTRSVVRWLLVKRHILIAAIGCCLGLQCVLAQSPTALPPMPFEDPGACPFEGCVYREWTATASVAVRRERRDSAPIAFRINTGEHISALTGVVVTRKPGRVRFQRAATVETESEPIKVVPGDMLFLLTYQGEGFTKAWFKGRIYDGVDVSDYFAGTCDGRQARCAGTLLEQPTAEWWVRIRNRHGQQGWTRETDKFDGKDELARNASPLPLLSRAR